MYTKLKHTILASALLFACSCSNDEVNSDTEPTSGLEMELRGVNSSIRDYSEIYVFNGENPNLDYFRHKVLNVERDGTTLKMKIPTGKWNLVLVGCSESDIRSRITPPAFTATKANVPMWTTQPSGGLLPDVPEIRTALINQQQINLNGAHTATASLDRNVAKIKVVLKDGVGFKTGIGHSFSLKNVPTSLSWDGSLHPNKTNPTVSSAPMTKAVTLSASTIVGHQKSDTAVFIIPAHKTLTAGDLSTHKITLEVKFTTAGSTTFQKDVVIDKVPQDNQILIVNVTAKGGVEAQVTVKEWANVNSSNTLDMYTMTLAGNTGKLATYTMNMKQERNWWVTLEDPNNFEFVDESLTFGQKTATPVSIQIRRKTAGAAMTTKLNLFIDGLAGLKEQYPIATLTQ